MLTRVDSTGNLLWWRSYHNQFQDFGFTIAPTSDGGFLLGGYTTDLSQPDTYVVKTDSLGNEQWHQALGSPGKWDTSASVAALADGTCLVAGAEGLSGPLGSDTPLQPTLYKFSSQGQLIWRKQIGPARQVAEFYAMHELRDGSIVVAGQQGDSTVNQMPEAVVYKVCANGDSLWYRNYKILRGPDSHNYLRDLRSTPDGGFVAAGFLFSAPPDTGTSDAWVFKIDSAGYLQPGGPPVTVQCIPTGLPAPGATTPEVELWPNPAPDGRYQLRVSPGATATLTDALGRVIWREQLLGANREIDLHAQPAGLYLLRLTWPDGRRATRKLVR